MIQIDDNSDNTSSGRPDSQLDDLEQLRRASVKNHRNLSFKRPGDGVNTDLWFFHIGMNRFPSIPNTPDPRFLTNAIRTATYTLWSFLPLNFWHQTTKGPNLYYIVICCLQMIKPISITAGSPTNAPPLAFIIFISMIKDFFEDSRRRRADREENFR